MMVNRFQVTPRALPPHPSGVYTRSVDGGSFASIAAGRIGRASKPPPQFGHTPARRSSTHAAQNVHS